MMKRITSLFAIAALLLSAMPASAASSCAKGEQKFYVASEWVVTAKYASRPHEARIEAQVICAKPEDNQTESGLQRIKNILVGKSMDEKFKVTVLSAMPLKD